MSKERGIIPFWFLPFPRYFCSSEFYRMPLFMIFLVWMLSRVVYEHKRITFNGFIVNLERGEFIFGRKKCSEETGISEQRLRTFIKKLIASNFLKKVTIKSTNKYTVYKVFLDHFGELTNYQINLPLTNKQPTTNHKQEIEADIKESKQCPQEEKLLFPVSLNPVASQAFQALSLGEKEAMIALFRKRNSQNPILHASPWLLKCIQENWHQEYISSSSQGISDHIEQNRMLASNVASKFQDHTEIVCIVRQDFFEIGKKGQPLFHIFYYEKTNAFKAQITMLLKKFNVNCFIEASSRIRTGS